MEMEKYINEDTIIKNETFNSFPELIICQICQCIMLEPVMCLKCQNYYCKKCIEDWKKKSPTCPNKCEEPIFKNVIEKNRLITKMKFKCIKGCGAEILFDDIKKHYSSNCLINKDNDDKEEKKSNIKILSKAQVKELKNKNENAKYFTSNYILFLYLIL